MVVDMVREISLQTDPQEMVQAFRARAHALYGGEHSMSLSRRSLNRPSFRITRSTRWAEHIDPWKEPHRLPLMQGGLLAELLYADEPRHIRDVRVRESDPAHDYLREARSLIALPLYDEGKALNMVVRMSSDPAGFDHTSLGDAMLIANLFGRSTNTLLVARRLKEANALLEHEMHRVAEIQRSLLPPELPRIATLDLAASYRTAARAGGDYYDFFDLNDGRWGFIIADVSGHGASAAVVMAMLRTMLHAECHQCATPGEVLCNANRQLCDHSDRYSGTFVTAFYGVYDPSSRSLEYSCAGHNPPLLVNRRNGVRELDDAHSLPLAVSSDCSFIESAVRLDPGDTTLMYTDGIVEAVNVHGEYYGRERLLSCIHEEVPNAQHIIDCVTMKLQGYCGDRAPEDDQTLVALRATE